MNEPNTTRRKFLKSAGAATAAIAAPTFIPASALGKDGAVAPSERIVMGGIGIGNQGRNDLGAYLGNKEVQYVAVCDVRKGVRDGAKGRVDGHYKSKDCTAYNDFRELLARDDIDAVHIATPDHWHAIQIIEACRAGKDVYCQKPETRTLREGHLIVDAARRYGRIVSGGSQRVAQDYRGVVNDCWSGKLGPIKGINVNVGNPSKPCNLPPENVPDDIDWEMWLGPAPWAPYSGKRCSGSFSTSGNSWRSYIDYSGGAMTDWGAHHFGGATYAVDVRELQPAETVYAEEGGKKFVILRFPNGIEITHNKPGRGNLQAEGTPGETKEPKEIPGYKVKGGIYGDFVNAVRTREKPFRDIEFAINTMAVCHLNILTHTLQRSLKWDAARQMFPDDAEANRYLDRARREPWQL
jgi:predicted dehydrogenase